MKARFVRRENGIVVERGNEVEIISTECGWYRIIDDMGEECLLPPSMFEITQAEPIPPETQPLGISTDAEWEAYLKKEYGV